MIFRIGPFVLICLLLTSCTASQPVNDGYFPIPEKFTGVWEPSDLRSGYKKIKIEKTPSGAILTERALYGPEKTPLIYKATLNIFAFVENRAYGIGEDRAIYAKTGLDQYPPEYFYFRLEMEDSRLLFENYFTRLQISKEYCQKKLDKNSTSLSPETHWQRINNRSCGKIPLFNKKEWHGRTPYYKKTGYSISDSSAAR